MLVCTPLSIPPDRALDVQCRSRYDRVPNLTIKISTRGSIQDTSLDVDKRVMAVNYFGPVGLAKGLLEAARGAESSDGDSAKSPKVAVANLSSGGGGPEKAIRFVVINSVQGKFGMAFRSSYAASKHALVGFFDSLRAEHAHRGVGVLNVFPGYIRTRYGAILYDSANMTTIRKRQGGRSGGDRCTCPSLTSR